MICQRDNVVIPRFITLLPHLYRTKSLSPILPFSFAQFVIDRECSFSAVDMGRNSLRLTRIDEPGMVLAVQSSCVGGVRVDRLVYMIYDAGFR
jgi:hypothetical protein